MGSIVFIDIFNVVHLIFIKHLKVSPEDEKFKTDKDVELGGLGVVLSVVYYKVREC